MVLTLLWIPASLAAAALQTARNTMQRRLTETIGTAGATHVRFLYGLPFAALFLAVALVLEGGGWPRPTARFGWFLLAGAATQVGATALMLAAMRECNFAVVTALIKLEPAIIAAIGFAVLGERLPLPAVGGIAVAVAGVAVVSWTPRTAEAFGGGGLRPVAFGIAAGILFSVAVVTFRGAILSLDGGSALLRSSTALVAGLALQTLMIGGWLAAFDRPALRATWRERGVSLPAGFVGAAASQCWFVAFALTAAANVRTLGLVEIAMAQVVAHRVLSQTVAPREIAGLVLIAGGIAALIAATA